MSCGGDADSMMPASEQQFISCHIQVMDHMTVNMYVSNMEFFLLEAK